MFFISVNQMIGNVLFKFNVIKSHIYLACQHFYNLATIFTITHIGCYVTCDQVFIHT